MYNNKLTIYCCCRTFFLAFLLLEHMEVQIGITIFIFSAETFQLCAIILHRHWVLWCSAFLHLWLFNEHFLPYSLFIFFSILCRLGEVRQAPCCFKSLYRISSKTCHLIKNSGPVCISLTLCLSAIYTHFQWDRIYSHNLRQLKMKRQKKTNEGPKERRQTIKVISGF